MTPQTSQQTVTLVVISLALVALVLLGGGVALVAWGKSVPETIWTLGGTTVGALASLLVSTRSTTAAPTATAPPPDTASR